MVDAPQTRDIYTVTELNAKTQAVLEAGFPAMLWVRGEVSNLREPSHSGHIYFSLKDPKSQVSCAMFRSRREGLRFKVENGLEVLAQAKVGLYAPQGRYQLIVEQMELAGAGALQQAFEALKQRLLKEGLFDDGRKRPLPAYPKTIGVVTSPTGAAIRDILQVLKRRYPAAGVIIYPAPVQGEGAAARIAEAIETANRRGECEALLIGRGGGSLEDLWAFNEEVVARAVYASAIPVVSGVGHEIDYTIADFVADKRASTPSAAAELLSPDSVELQARLAQQGAKLRQRMAGLLETQTRHVEQLFRRLPRPVSLVQNLAQRVDGLNLRLQHSMDTRIARWRDRLNRAGGAARAQNPLHRLRARREQCVHLEQRLRACVGRKLEGLKEQSRFLSRALEAASPLSILQRGYAIVADEGGNIVRKAEQLSEGAATATRFAQGSVRSVVKQVNPEDGLRLGPGAGPDKGKTT